MRLANVFTRGGWFHLNSGCSNQKEWSFNRFKPVLPIVTPRWEWRLVKVHKFPRQAFATEIFLKPGCQDLANGIVWLPEGVQSEGWMPFAELTGLRFQLPGGDSGLCFRSVDFELPATPVSGSLNA